jgi:hypothetical protein
VKPAREGRKTIVMFESLIQILEGVMLVCFGVSWPIDILHTVRLRRASGKSLLFMVLIIVGYLAGLGSKCLRSIAGHRSLEPVTWLYVLNVLLLAVDLALSYHYQKQEAAANRAAQEEAYAKTP